MEGPAGAAAPRSAGSYALHLGLFALTCVTTVWSGRLAFGTWQAGLGFGGTLMAILMCHEMGHYLAARRHRIDASLPYFVPLPPQISLGTLGAVIRMRQPISNRNHLVDVGAAGPLAGLAVAVPLLLVGLHLSALGPIAPGSYLEGNSLLYIAAKYAVFGRYLPAADGTDVILHPVAFAAWVGLLITMINLIPVGQLDGGHIACAFLGQGHERWSRWLHRILLLVGAGAAGVLVVEARAAGLGWGDALEHGLAGGLPWGIWAGILLAMRFLAGGMYHPPVGRVELGPGRRWLGLFVALVLISIFMPVPLRPAL